MAVLHSRLGYFILVILVLITNGFAIWDIRETMSTRPFVIRRLSNSKEQVDLVCPDNHLMLTPFVAYGASIRRRTSSLRLEKDCLGTNSQLVKQSEQCLRNNTCSISLRKGLRLTHILSGPQRKCLKRFPKFILISLPKCVPREEIFDICSEWTTGTYLRGILGRHPDIPATSATGKSCYKVMSFSISITLALTLEKFDTDTSYYVTVQWTTTHGFRETRTLRYNHETFIGTGDNFTLTWENPNQEESSFYLIYDVLQYDGTHALESAIQRYVPDLKTVFHIIMSNNVCEHFISRLQKLLFSDNVINMCSRYKPELVDKEVGIIRSHNIYPWDYGAESVDCRKVIKIGEGKQLLLRLEAAEVDEDRDTFRIIHTKVNTQTLVVKGNTKRFNATLSEGVVEIYLTVSGRSKTGKGFIIYFEKIGETAQKNSDIVKISSKRNHKQREIRRKRKRRGQSGDNNRQRMNKKRKSKKPKKKFRKSNKNKTKRSRRIKKTKTHRRKTRI
ncbi:uncharacterized protein [Argopecten irradians]|uniref:uncharacterized protein n=1 Tax=Argopecten irradians TaxID=31199 RepID=UPI00371D5A51